MPRENSSEPGPEYNPDDNREASESSKDSFLQLVSQLTEGEKDIVKGPGRSEFIYPTDTQTVYLYFNPESPNIKDRSNHQLAMVNIMDREALNGSIRVKRTIYQLLTDGTFERLTKGVLDDEAELGDSADLHAGQIAVKAKAMLKKLKDEVAADEEMRQLGITKLTESEAQEIIGALQVFLDEKRKKQHPERIS